MKGFKLMLGAVGAFLLAAHPGFGQVAEGLVRDRMTGEVVEYLSVELPRENIPHEVREALDRGEEIKNLVILVPQIGEEGKRICYLRYELERCFIKSWSTSGDADERPTEEIAFYYNKIAFEYVPAEIEDSRGEVSALDALLVINY